MKTKKVLYVATVVKTHIMQFHIPYLKMLQEMGYETAVAARNDYDNPSECQIPYCDQYYDIKFERSPFKLANIKAYKKLKKIISEGNFDVIHCHTPVGGVLARLAARGARKNGTKVIYTAHGFHFYKGGSLKNWLIYYPIEKLCSRWCDAIITINNDDYELSKSKMYAKDYFRIKGMGVDENKFVKSEDARLQTRKDLGISDSTFVITTVGELNENKNQITVLKGIKILKEQYEINDIVYLIVGQGDKAEYLKHQTIDMNIDSQVKFLGYRKDTDKIYSASDLFVLLSHREGLGLAPIEAMMCSMPIITSNKGGFVEYNHDDSIGYSIDCTDANELAVKIKLLKDDDKQRISMGIQARKIAENYSLSNSLKTMKNIYERYTI